MDWQKNDNYPFKKDGLQLLIPTPSTIIKDVYLSEAHS